MRRPGATAGAANAPLALSCPAVSLCVGGGSGGVVTSIDPTGGAGTWTAAPVGAIVPMTGVSCPSESLCVTTDVADRVLVSRDPTAPDPVWSVATLPSPYGLRDVTCTAPSLCVGVAGRDQVLTSTDPAGGASAWADTNLPSTISALPIVSGVSCPSVALCAAVNDWGDVFVSRNPTSRAPAWTKFRAASQSIDPGVDGISCPSVSLCVAVADGATVGNGGEIITSTTVAAAHPAWRVTHFDRIRGLDSVSCPSISLCVATDADDGSFFVSTHPTGGASSWKMVTVSGFHPDSVSCATPSLCVAIDEFTSSAIASADPSGGAASWSAAQIDINFLGRAEISCNGSFCIVGDDVGAAVLGFPAPTPTPAQLRKALRKQLVPSGRPAALLTHGGYPYSFRIPAPGRLTVSWYTTTARSVLARQRSRPTLIATASAYIAADTTDRIKLRLTREGRRLIRRGPRLPVTAEALFTTAQHTLVARSNFTLSPAGA